MNGREVAVRIDRIAVEMVQDDRAERVEEAIRKALALLAARLSQAPLGFGDRALALALRRLEVDPLDPAWLGSPGAAARLADDLYRGLLEAMGGGGDGV